MHSFQSQFEEKEINDQMLQQKDGASVKGHVEQDHRGVWTNPSGMGRDGKRDKGRKGCLRR